MRKGNRDLGRAVRCPACGAVTHADLFAIVDAQADPEAALQARSGDLNRVRCAACGEGFAAEVPVLYHDSVRSLTVVYAPGDPLRAEAAANELLARLFETAETLEPADYLLAPLVAVHLDDFVSLLAAPPAGPIEERVSLDEAATWALSREAEDVLQVLEIMSQVSSEQDLLEAVNLFPSLTELDTVLSLEQAARQAELDGEVEAAEVLADVAALLRVYLLNEEEQAVDNDGGPAGEGASSLLPGLAGPLTKGLGLEEDLPEEAERAADLLLEPEAGEGYREHAEQFGALLESMLREVGAPAVPMPDLLIPMDVPAEALAKLLATSTHDDAAALLDAHPRLVSHDVVTLLRRIGQHAANVENEALVSHLEMLIGAIYVAGLGDTDEPESSE